MTNFSKLDNWRGRYQSEGCDYMISKETLSLAENQELVPGRVIGVVTEHADAIVVANPVLAGAGDGTLVLAAEAYGDDVQAGDYKFECVEKTADSGKFALRRPDGTIDGYAIVGVDYVGDLKGKISDGAVDFDQTSSFTVHVTRTAAATKGEVKAWDPDATDGSQVAKGVSYDFYKTGAGEVIYMVAHVRGCRVWGIYLDYGDATPEQIAIANAQLAENDLIVA